MSNSATHSLSSAISQLNRVCLLLSEVHARYFRETEGVFADSARKDVERCWSCFEQSAMRFGSKVRELSGRNFAKLAEPERRELFEACKDLTVAFLNQTAEQSEWLCDRGFGRRRDGYLRCGAYVDMLFGPRVLRYIQSSGLSLPRARHPLEVFALGDNQQPSIVEGMIVDGSICGVIPTGSGACLCKTELLSPRSAVLLKELASVRDLEISDQTQARFPTPSNLLGYLKSRIACCFSKKAESFLEQLLPKRVTPASLCACVSLEELLGPSS